MTNMATTDAGIPGHLPAAVVASQEQQSESQQFHRIRTVRLQQGMSLRSAARQMGSTIRTLRHQEQESSDLRISELHKWQKALDVPLTELVVETDEPLSRPVMERARLIRLMKTAAAIHEHSPNVAIQRMAQTLVDQLVEVMPELEEVSPWHTFGQRRSLDEYGKVAERRLPAEAFEYGFDED